MDPSDISVVVQGGIRDEWYVRISASIRKYLPGSEIVLSTWSGTDVLGLDYDKVVLSEDPGCFRARYKDTDKPLENNINRQIVSTREGIKESSRKFVMKLRSDSYLDGIFFLSFYEKFGNEKRVLTFEPRNPWGNFRGQFCFCDFWFFGTKEKLLELWDIPLYEHNVENRYDMLAEEYLVQALCIKKYGQENITDGLYKKILAERIVIIPTRKSSVKSIKYPDLNCFTDVCLKHYVISHSEWKWISGQGNYKDAMIVKLQNIAGNIVLLVKPLFKLLFGFVKGNG